MLEVRLIRETNPSKRYNHNFHLTLDRNTTISVNRSVPQVESLVQQLTSQTKPNFHHHQCLATRINNLHNSQIIIQIFSGSKVSSNKPLINNSNKTTITNNRPSSNIMETQDSNRTTILAANISNRTTILISRHHRKANSSIQHQCQTGGLRRLNLILT